MSGRGFLSKYFIGAAAKNLKGTEVDPKVSRGHEFQGVDVFRAFVGTPSDRETIPVTYLWMDDSGEDPVRLELTGTWYNSRKRQPHRSPEYRLYYPAAAEPVVYRAKENDTLFLCMTADRRVLAILCPLGSSIEQKLLWLFGLSLTSGFELSQRDIAGEGGRDVDFAARFVLEEIGIEPEEATPAAFEQLLRKFGLVFPPTAKLSKFARDTVKDVDPVAQPDKTLMAWMEHEEALFRHMEKEVLAERLRTGFVSGNEVDVDGFLKFSLGVQNRRKSRAGYAFGHHIEAVLQANAVRYKREATTEKRNAADFLFPSEEEYADPVFPAARLTMLAAKTTCKDRWRQVLAEADRINEKHLLTLEPAISRTQTDEMQKQNLRLVLPQEIHQSYHEDQQGWLLSVENFLEIVRGRE
ncbi:type II restriction endonuclease [Tritonibacter mobilis]|uniref:Type II restriction endonuclease n=1 Tax=Tritonibacter mobilis F1926 TaxID=1265309 RepID=A0A1B1A5Q6_9RHOB|nr:type II restriction endonuclease [Tritonibacter mobilis]ANP41910.1 type II restriction endonuclease [Tritonibacter mobilis F1926]KJZ24056.1 type II restriction endonuclease [Tritonibacter mobilis]